MKNRWLDAHERYSWVVNLRTYKHATEYRDHFNDIIDSNNVIDFEKKFCSNICESGNYEVAGEVCYWKNYGTAMSRNKITKKLLEYLQHPDKWHSFVISVKEVSKNPTHENFLSLRSSCNQVRGFATPITFLSFYSPEMYPMVDKHIAEWWKNCNAKYGYKNYTLFSQRKEDGWIQTYSPSDSRQNWEAYLAWKEFCNDYSKKIKNAYGIEWRARDVEMAVWMALKNGIDLDVL